MGFKKFKKKRRSKRTLDAAEIQELIQESKNAKKKITKIKAENLDNTDKAAELSSYEKLLQYYNIQLEEEDFDGPAEVKFDELDYTNHYKFKQQCGKINFVPSEAIDPETNYASWFNKPFKQYKLDCGSAKTIKEPILVEPKGFESYKTAKSHPFIEKLITNTSNPTLHIPSKLLKRLKKSYLSDGCDRFDSIPLKHKYYEPLQNFSEQMNSQEFLTLFTSLSHYVDTLFTDLNYSNTDIIRFAYSLHVLSHVTQHRETITSNSTKLSEGLVDEEADVVRDQGFTRPSVLLLLPTKSAVSHIVSIFSKLMPIAKKGYEKFESEFNISEEKIIEQREHFKKTGKPLDFIQIFNGDMNDCFRFGIRLENGLLHLFSPFYKSDIIVSSPLGLRGVVADSSTGDYDFLSSIQVCVVDSANVIQYQNWSFLLQVIEKINCPLKKHMDCDIRRLRRSTIDGFSSYYRQNIVLASNPTILINDLLARSSNCRGVIRLGKPSIKSTPKLAKLLNISQTFIKLDCDSIAGSFEAILEKFKQTLDSLAPLSKLLVVAQDYSHYLQIKESLNSSQIEYKACHEYSGNKKLSGARRDFYHGDCKMLVTTFRFVFFKRYLLRGGNYAIVLGPPEYPPVYNHLLKSLGSGARVLCYYTNYSGIALNNLLGASSASRLLASDRNISNII